MKRTFLALTAVTTSVSAENPITKVVSLLNDMQTQMQKDAKADLAAFKKMECWCKTHREEKGEAVKKAQATIKAADDTIKEKTGLISGLEEEIKNLKADVVQFQEDLKSVAALRKKEAADAAVAQTDMKETITALGTALEILGKVQSGLIQHPTAFVQLKKTLDPFRSTLRSDLWSLMGKLNSSSWSSSSSASTKQNFLQQHEEPEAAAAEEERDYSSGPVSPNAKKGGVAGVTSYSSNSGAIFGLLAQMKEDFEKQLSDSVASEAAKTKGFQTLSAEKNKAIALAKEQITAKQKDLGTAKIDKANATTLKEETMMDLTADQKFIVEMEAQCKDAVDAYGERSKERSDEMKAVGEAIGFLTSDEAREIFNKGFGFIQIRSHNQSNSNENNSKTRANLIKVLLQTYRKSGGRRGQALALLAANSKLDAFVKVKEALDKLKEELVKEQKTEFETRDTCMADLNTNEVATKDKSVLLEDTEASVAELAAKMESLAGEIAAAEQAIKDTNKMVAEATEDRKAENESYKETVNDQELVVKVLKVAMSKLEGFYGKVALVQESTEQEPAPKQATYKRQQGGNGAIGLIQVIIADAENVIKISTMDENKAQTDYEKAMADAKAELEALNTAVVSKKDESAKLSSKKEDEEGVVSSTKEELLALGKENSALHGDCDFVLKNFDVRQQARTEEIESIEQAKQVLSGADFE